MAELLVYYAHPGHRHSQANRAMLAAAGSVDGIELVDLYAEYPRFRIDVDREQERLLEHEVIVFQFPLFWYSTPSLIKEWQDLVLEHGFAYGPGGDRLAGKRVLLAVTAGGSVHDYGQQGLQRYPLRTFLRPFEQTARLCQMEFAAPYVLYDSLHAPGDGRLAAHVDGYRRLLEAVRDDRYDFGAAREEIVDCAHLPLLDTDHG